MMPCCVRVLLLTFSARIIGLGETRRQGEVDLRINAELDAYAFLTTGPERKVWPRRAVSEKLVRGEKLTLKWVSLIHLGG